MPYSEQHKQQTRRRIVECARELFTRKGFTEVSIDEVMARAGLTRGGFYNHFSNKEDLFVEAVESFGECNPTDKWDGVELDFSKPPSELATQMIQAYLSHQHLADAEAHCPMIALPSDVARASPRVKAAYRGLVERMVQVFEAGQNNGTPQQRHDQALALTALCVGGMVLARTFADAGQGNAMVDAAQAMALAISNWQPPPSRRKQTLSNGMLAASG